MHLPVDSPRFLDLHLVRPGVMTQSLCRPVALSPWNCSERRWHDSWHQDCTVHASHSVLVAPVALNSWILTPEKPRKKQRLRWYLLIYYQPRNPELWLSLAVTFQVLRARRCACRLHCHPRRKRLSHVPWNFHEILSHWKSATKKMRETELLYL